MGAILPAPFALFPLRAVGPAAARCEDIVREAHGLVERGHHEIVLTGVNIGTYHHDGHDLLHVVQALEAVAGLERLRISSIEPTTISDALMDWMATSASCVPICTFPCKVATTRCCERMKRRYTRAEFVAFIERVAARVPDICLGTDVMVGFPGEDESAFSRTRSLLADLPLAYFHVFPYSERPHTMRSAIPITCHRR